MSSATDCTLFQYIGELCRYLVNSPPHPQETAHRLRLCLRQRPAAATSGSGSQQRFRIPRILEFYAATEGIVSLYNCEGKPGAIGRIPPFLAHRSPVALIKFDAADRRAAARRGGPLHSLRRRRDRRGDRPDRRDRRRQRRFEGYTRSGGDRTRRCCATCSPPGDRWFRTGDLMRRDAAGYFYFVDRIGDTFRWKGENVSTTEVAAAIARLSRREPMRWSMACACPGNEGRAGMAAIVAGPGFDLAALWRASGRARCPTTRSPLFLRMRSGARRDADLAAEKAGAVREGFDPAATQTRSISTTAIRRRLRRARRRALPPHHRWRSVRL